MTDKDIIDGLACCGRYGTGCAECPYRGGSPCSEVLIDDASALVDRLQAEIEQLRKNDFDNLDFSKCSIDEKYWALLLLAVATCKDMEFLKIIRDKFLVGLDNTDNKETEG